MGGALGRPAAVEVVEERGEDWHRAQAQFRVVDEDGSGRLDKEEVAGLLDMLGMGRLAGVVGPCRPCPLGSPLPCSAMWRCVA